MKVNHVLIPIDRSAFSLTILPSIEQFLAPAYNALIFFHVAEPPLHARHMDEQEFAAQRQRFQEALTAEVMLELQPLTDPLRAKGYAVAIETALGEPLPAIAHFVAQHQIGLLALTTHGRSGLSRVLFGSVAQQLIQQLTIPILLFHPAEEHEGVTL